VFENRALWKIFVHERLIFQKAGENCVTRSFIIFALYLFSLVLLLLLPLPSSSSSSSSSNQYVEIGRACNAQGGNEKCLQNIG
jgi:hypothetical protein